MQVYKYAGAILGSVLVVILIARFSGIFYGDTEDHGAPPAEVAQAPAPAAPAPAPAPEPAAAPAQAEAAAPAAAAGAESLGALLAAASAEDGQGSSIRCVACHTFTEGGANRVGPNLWGVVGRPKGSAEGFNYSPAMASAGGAWTLEDLDGFLADPGAFIAGTVMNFAGFADAGERAGVLLYLRSLSADPVPLPAP